MTIKSLFQTWNRMKEMLIDPHLPDDAADMLADQSMQVIQAMSQTPSTGLMDVLLKLETYGREVEAGPCDECDALLGSALRDRIAILGGLGHTGRGATPLDEWRHAKPLERQRHDDVAPVYVAYRGQDPGSPPP